MQDASASADAKKTLGAAIHASQSVTNYAQATRTVIPTLESPPDWYKPIQAHIDAAKLHSERWISVICPQIGKAVSSEVTGYNTLFQATAESLVNLLAEIEMRTPQGPTEAQRSAVTEKLQALIDHCASAADKLTDVGSSVSDYHDELVGDLRQATQDISVVKQYFADGREWVSQLHTQLDVDFVEVQALGPCNAIVELKSEIKARIEGIEANMGVLAAVMAEATQTRIQKNARQAIQSLADVHDFWASVKAKNSAVLTDLENAKGEGFANIMKEVDLKTAMDQWQQLADFVRSLY
ncbi:MAG: HBL/NHE enterotoxin family protein [Gammaproteobacteria bacterium]